MDRLKHGVFDSLMVIHNLFGQKLRMLVADRMQQASTSLAGMEWTIAEIRFRVVFTSTN